MHFKGKYIPLATDSFFQKILHRTAEDFRKAEDSFRAGLVDVLVALFVHLDRAEADIASLGKLRLCAAIERADTLEVGVGKILPHFGVNNIGELTDVCFMERGIHLPQIIKRKNLENIAELPAGEPLVVGNCPAAWLLQAAARKSRYSGKAWQSRK